LERIARIASRDARSRSSTLIELGQAIKGLVGIAIVGPILPQLAEIVIEGTILLRQENNVIKRPGRVNRGGYRFIAVESDNTRATAAARATPAYQI
jgi:hypothetical protein